MSTTTKGFLALIRDLMAHQPDAEQGMGRATPRRAGAAVFPLPAARTYDLATQAGDSRWFTSTGSPPLGERLSVLRAERDLARFLRPD